MSKESKTTRRNPYAMAHSMRGGAGAGAHRDRRSEIIDELTDPYSPEWLESCPASFPRAGSEISPTSGSYTPLSREFLLDRGYCCGSGCANCPYDSDDGSHDE